MRRSFFFRVFSLPCLAALCLCQQASDPWEKSELVEVPVVVQAIQSSKPPMVISVAFPVLYRSRHLPHAIDAGPGSKPEGIELLKKAVANTPKDADIVVYCGCCPMVKCPNLRPSYRALKEMGFTRIRILNIPTNMHTDWYTKNYPSEPGAAAQK